RLVALHPRAALAVLGGQSGRPEVGGFHDMVVDRDDAGDLAHSSMLPYIPAMTADDLGTPHLAFERRGPLAYVTVDRPDARNALTTAMYFGIKLACDRVNADPDLHGMV